MSNSDEEQSINANETPRRIASSETLPAVVPIPRIEASDATQGQQCPYKATEVRRRMATKGAWVLPGQLSNQGPSDQGQ